MKAPEYVVVAVGATRETIVAGGFTSYAVAQVWAASRQRLSFDPLVAKIDPGVLKPQSERARP